MTYRAGRSAVAAVGAAVAGALLLSACSTGSTPAGSGPSTSQTPSSTSTGPSASTSQTPSASPTASATDVAPLTGLPAASAAAAVRPIVVVDVGMIGSGTGLRGIDRADLVYQEFNRAGSSRLVAAYQSTDAVVGPVAATAPLDVRVTSLMALPVLAFAGGPTGFVKQVGPTAVTPRSTGTYGTLFSRSGSLLYVSTAALRASAPKAPPAPQGLLPFGGPSVAEASGAKAVHHVTVAVPGAPVETWSLVGRGWVGPGGAVVTNLVVQNVAYKSITSAKDPTVHSALVVGTGTATVVGGGYAAVCTWSRPQPLQITNFFDAHALPVGLAPGRTWIVLAPAGTKVTTS